MASEQEDRTGAWRRWRDQLRLLGHVDALHFDPEAWGALDLTHGHPGGMAQLLSGRVTLLTNLIRDPAAAARAARAAAQVERKAADLAEDRGIDALVLTAGVMEWREDGRMYQAPVLVQPAKIRATGADFEVMIAGRPFMNPALTHTLVDLLHVEVDLGQVAAAATGVDSFHPDVALEMLQRAVLVIPGVRLFKRLYLQTMSDVGSELAGRAIPRIHPVLDAVAGVTGAAERLRNSSHRVSVNSTDERSPLSDHLLLDASGEQEVVIAQASAGSSFTVRTVPGAGVSQAVTNIVGTLVAQGKRVAVVAASRASLDAVRRKLSGCGLPGLAVAPSSLRTDVIAGISRNERAAFPDEERSKHAESYERVREALLRYRSSLSAINPEFGVSVEQALNELARLAMLPTPPKTTVRLHSSALRRLAQSRTREAALLKQAAEFGQFELGPEDSPWYGASFTNPAEAENAFLLAKRLSETDLDVLHERAREVFAAAGLRKPRNIQEIGAGVALLLRVRGTLDRFVPAVYDRSLAEVIAATAPRKQQPMSGASRRRLRQLAREYVRPGVHVGDLHQAMRSIQEERTLWRSLASGHRPPNVPIGISDLNVMHTAFQADLAELSKPLADERGLDVMTMPLDDLHDLLDALARDVGSLGHLHERTQILRDLDTAGLSELVEDFSRRHVPAEAVADELELAWWQSVLELLLQRDGSLLNADTQALSRLEREFIVWDRALISDNSRALASAFAQRWKTLIDTYPAEASVLRRHLLEATISPEVVLRQLPQLGRTVAPVWLLSPYDFGRLVPERAFFDTVLVLDAASLTCTEAVLPIAHAEQVIAFGDPVIGRAMEFEIAPSATRSIAADGPTAFESLAEVLPQYSLDVSYRPGGRTLASLVNDRLYNGAIRALMSADEFIGHPAVDVTIVDRGGGAPDPETGMVEALPAEVQRVVDMVVSAAAWHPDESLMVVTASERHAAAVRAAVRRESLGSAPLADTLDPRRPEPFVVLTIEQAATRSRDRVIFSVGYGRTPHGRMLSRLGAVSEDEAGVQALGIALTRARRHVSIVSSLRPREADLERLQGGSLMLAQLLVNGVGNVVPAARGVDQPMLTDLGERLKTRGLHVAGGVAGTVGLAVSDGHSALVVETDADFQRDTLREAVRLHPTQLRRLGWSFMRVYTFELFSDPAKIADRIQRVLQDATAATAAEPNQAAPKGRAS